MHGPSIHHSLFLLKSGGCLPSSTGFPWQCGDWWGVGAREEGDRTFMLAPLLAFPWCGNDSPAVGALVPAIPVASHSSLTCLDKVLLFSLPHLHVPAGEIKLTNILFRLGKLKALQRK